MTEEEKKKLARAITKRLPAPEEIRDDWGRFIVETALPGGVWARPGLAPRDRSLVTIAALCALHYPKELGHHIRRGLHNGLTRQEICEAIMHMSVYAGFPAAVEAMAVARDIFENQESRDN